MKNKLNERKQINRDAKQSRNTWAKCATDNSRDEQPQRFIYWDDEPYEKITRLQPGTGRFTERYFEKDDE